MAVLSDADRRAVRKMFENASRDVRLVRVTSGAGGEDEDAFAAAIREVADEVSQVQIEVEDRRFDEREGLVERAPGLVLQDGTGRDLGIRFYGTPGGYEFGALVTAMADAASDGSALSQATRDQLASLQDPVQIMVFSTPTCPYCPRAVRLAGLMALASEHVQAQALDAMAFPQLANLYQVQGVPRTIFNRKVHVEGAVPEPVFLERLLAAVHRGASI